MKIALVSEHASPLATLGGEDAGGQNVHVASLATDLGRLGHEVVVHTRRDDPALPARVEMAPGVVVDHVDAGPAEPLSKDRLLPHMGAFARHLTRSWSAERPDVVHAHFWMSGRAALSAASALAIPVVQTFHALGVVKRRHQGAADTSPASRLAIEADVACRAERVVATSSAEVFELARLGVRPDRVTVIPCGVDLRRFSTDGPKSERAGLRGPNAEAGLRRVVVVGRLVTRKGVDDVIRALPSVPRTELVVVGGPDAAELAADPEANRLSAVARELGVADRVHLRGRMSQEDLPSVLRSADVVACVPWYEPFGLVALEAMACGVPVIASAVGGLCDTVVDGATGIHVPPRDPDAVAAALRRLLDDPHLARRLGQAGAERARARYGWDSVARATVEVYQDVAAPALVASTRGRS